MNNDAPDKTPEADSTPPESAPADRTRDALSSRRAEDDPDDVLWEGTWSAKGIAGSWVLAAVATVILIVATVMLLGTGILWVIPLVVAVLIWIVLGFVVLYEKWNIAYTLTNQRFLHRSGILSQKTDRIEVIDMDDVSYEQSLLQRFVGVGNIRISSSDRSHPELTLYSIENVQEVADLIDDVRRKERRRRGLHIEAI